MEIVIKNIKKAFKHIDRMVDYFPHEMQRPNRKEWASYTLIVTVKYDGQGIWEYAVTMDNPDSYDPVMDKRDYCIVAHFKDVYEIQDYKETLMNGYARIHHGVSGFFDIFCKKMFEKYGYIVELTDYKNWSDSIYSTNGRDFVINCKLYFIVKTK